MKHPGWKISKISSLRMLEEECIQGLTERLFGLFRNREGLREECWDVHVAWSVVIV